MRKKLQKGLFFGSFIIIGILLMVWVFRQISLKDIYDLFVNTNHYLLIWFLLSSLAIVSLHSLRWKLIIKTTGYKIPFWKLIQYKIAGMGISFLTPGAKLGGEPIRALLLKKHGVEFHKGLSTIITDKIVDLSVQGVLFIIASIVALMTIAMPTNMSVALIAFTILAIALIIYVYYQIFNDRNLFVKLFRLLRLNKIEKLKNTEHKLIDFERLIVKFHKEDTKEFYISILITMCAWFVMFIEYYLAAALVGFHLGIMQIFMIITMMGVAYLMPIPLALGVFEAGEITIFKLLKLNAAAGVGLAMIIRSRDLLYSLLSFIILFYNGITWNNLKKKIKE